MHFEHYCSLLLFSSVSSTRSYYYKNYIRPTVLLVRHFPCWLKWPCWKLVQRTKCLITCCVVCVMWRRSKGEIWEVIPKTGGIHPHDLPWRPYTSWCGTNKQCNSALTVHPLVNHFFKVKKERERRERRNCAFKWDYKCYCYKTRCQRGIIKGECMRLKGVETCALTQHKRSMLSLLMGLL